MSVLEFQKLPIEDVDSIESFASFLSIACSTK